ncbi:MAG: ABC transporter ATP-binding protein [Phototrophicaceae bacterium]
MFGMDGNRRIFEQEVVKPQDLSKTMGRFANYFRPYWWIVALVMILVAVNTWTQVVAPQIVGQAVDCYLFDAQAFNNLSAFPTDSESPAQSNCWFTDDDSVAIQTRILADDGIAQADKQAAINQAKIAGVTTMVFALLGLYFLGAILSGVSFFAMAYAGQSVLRDMRKDLFDKMKRLSLGYYTKNEAGDVMSRITNDTSVIQQAFGFALLSVLGGVVLIVSLIFQMLVTNWVYGLLSLTVAPFMMLATLYLSSQARKAFRISRQELGSVNADLQESLSGAREVQAFNREDENIEQFSERNAANRDANIRAASFTAALNPTLEALGFVGIAIVVVVGGFSLLTNTPLFGVGAVVSLGLVITYLAYVQQINRPIAQIATLWTNIQSAIAGGERIFELLDAGIDIQDKEGAQALPQIQGNIRFDNVWAEYEVGKPVLKGITFEAKQGQTVAIVGQTGAGKTTIINLLPRFWDVTDGSVTIDGYDVRDVTGDSLRSQIGIVLQDSFLFSDTVMNNIRYGKLEATDEEVIAAAKLVAAHDFIERLPEGYDTVLGERGSGLSQGQRQLISIARAALLDPRVLILDEATSSVDTRTERVIQAAFEKLLNNRTSFVIAHRLSTIRNADLVLVLSAGEIMESGTHDSLLAEKGMYHELYMSQFRHEGDETIPDASEPVTGD